MLRSATALSVFAHRSCSNDHVLLHSLHSIDLTIQLAPDGVHLIVSAFAIGQLTHSSELPLSYATDDLEVSFLQAKVVCMLQRYRED